MSSRWHTFSCPRCGDFIEVWGEVGDEEECPSCHEYIDLPYDDGDWYGDDYEDEQQEYGVGVGEALC